jgi:hypothetical protein
MWNKLNFQEKMEYLKEMSLKQTEEKYQRHKSI